MKARFSLGLIESIQDYCNSQKPKEACGLLIGHIKGRVWNIKKIIFSPNLAQMSDNYFLIDSALHLKANREFRSYGWQVIGHFHSHPNGQAFPSLMDIEQNFDPDWVWLILDHQQDYAAFLLTEPITNLEILCE